MNIGRSLLFKDPPRWFVLTFMALPPATLVPLMLIPNFLPFKFPYADNVYHVIAFGLLILPYTFWARAVQPRAFLLLLLFGCLIEATQPLFGRDAEWTDLASNLVGLTMGLGLGFVLRRLWRTRQVQ